MCFNTNFIRNGAKRLVEQFNEVRNKDLCFSNFTVLYALVIPTFLVKNEFYKNGLLRFYTVLNTLYSGFLSLEYSLECL